MLLDLIKVKKNLIEPIFIAISTFNVEMGDWIIKELLKNNREISHIAILGEIVLCNKAEIPRRIYIILD